MVTRLCKLLTSAMTYSGSEIPLSEKVSLMPNLLLRRPLPRLADMEHLVAAAKWLRQAQEVCHGDGVSAAYYMRGGWAVPYPETSGYIIGTYLACADVFGDNSFVEQAIKLGNWEIEIQSPNGGMISSPIKRCTRVFNTGQVILGWCALYERTNISEYLHAASRAGQFLLQTQESDGAWRSSEYTYCGARTYHARIDWALLCLARATGEERFAKAASKNLRWILDQQMENGWFRHCGFDSSLPITHVIGYTLRGLLECSEMNIAPAYDVDIWPCVVKSADAICDAVRKYKIGGIPGLLPTSFDSSWESTDRHSCLTGNAQLACFLFRIAKIAGEDTYRRAAETLVEGIKTTHITNTPCLSINGAVSGTFPFYWGYHANSYPNWATKFFADALIMKLRYETSNCYISA